VIGCHAGNREFMLTSPRPGGNRGGVQLYSRQSAAPTDGQVLIAER